MRAEMKSYLDALHVEKVELTLEFIETLQKRHLASFSFNNMAVLLGKEISLHVEDIVQKIVVENRGGYCFEHNKLMYEVLKECGFNVRLIIGKVVNNQKLDSPRTHRITVVEFENRHYLVDVGFGYVCINAPLDINSQAVHNGYRVVENKGIYSLEIAMKEDFFRLYCFDLGKYDEADCAMGNFYSSNYPKAVFVNNTVFSLIKKGVTLSFRNNSYHKIRKEGEEVVKVTSALALYELLHQDFNIEVSHKEAEAIFRKSEGLLAPSV